MVLYGVVRLGLSWVEMWIAKWTLTKNLGLIQMILVIAIIININKSNMLTRFNNICHCASHNITRPSCYWLLMILLWSYSLRAFHWKQMGCRNLGLEISTQKCQSYTLKGVTWHQLHVTWHQLGVKMTPLEHQSWSHYSFMAKYPCVIIIAFYCQNITLTIQKCHLAPFKSFVKRTVIFHMDH